MKKAGKPNRNRSAKLRTGGASALMLVILIAALIALNIGAGVLEKRYGWRADYSFNSISTHSGETRELLSDLKHPVHIWALFRNGDEDAPLLELLDRYAAASGGKITWEQADPGLNPALTVRFSTETLTPGESDLIIWCEETGRFRVLGPDDYVDLSIDQETGEYTYAGWTYERSITMAVDYVTRERVPRIVILQGHGELNPEETADYESMMTANQYEVVYETLEGTQYIPEPTDLLVMFSPLRDLTDAELGVLTEYAARGGSFLFTCDFSDPVEGMPNFSTLLRSYGFLPRMGVVIADEKATDTYYSGMPTYLIPEVVSTDITMDMIAAGQNHLLLPGCRAFEETEESDRNLTVLPVLRSGETSYLKVLAGETTSIDRAEGDAQGPFALALEARRITAEGYLSRAFVIGCSSALTQQQIYAMTDTAQLNLKVADFLMNTVQTGGTIAAKDALRPALGIGSLTLGSVMIVALPAAVLLMAMLVLYRRRSR